eukprot:jgi/Botrbrau1/18360/Bobra.0179s0085.1
MNQMRNSVICLVSLLLIGVASAGRALTSTTEVVTLQGGVGNPQNTYTGGGQNLYLTNDSSSLGSGASTGLTQNFAGASILGSWANTFASLGNNETSNIPFFDGSLGIIFGGQPFGIGISTTSILPTLWTSVQGDAATDYGDVAGGISQPNQPGRRRSLLSWVVPWF